LTPGVLDPTSMNSPMSPQQQNATMKIPLCRALSAMKPPAMHIAQAVAYGGTDMSWAVLFAYPSSLIMVGRNRATLYTGV
jgi:hypothetical protein